ncbi:hypothetical protein BDF14DRAFT_1821104 [Spinellus fusiger]|nr:hypothetical protein BDF14DRAFT_1821104 [Spinellus fusiger]
MYESRKINTAYLNGTAKDEIKKKGTTKMEVSAAVKDFIEQCSRIKTVISSGRRFSS